MYEYNLIFRLMEIGSAIRNKPCVAVLGIFGTRVGRVNEAE